MIEGEWHLDRKVTLSLIIALMMNICTSVWWASSISFQVTNQQKQIETHENQINIIMRDQSNFGERLAKIESSQLYIIKATDRIEDRLKGQR